MQQRAFRIAVVAYGVGLALVLLQSKASGTPASVEQQWMLEILHLSETAKALLTFMTWPFFIAGAVALIGMFFFHIWARWLFLLWSVVGLGACFLVPWWYETAWDNAQADLLAMIQGAILGLAFLGGHFGQERQSN